MGKYVKNAWHIIDTEQMMVVELYLRDASDYRDHMPLRESAGI